MPLKVGDRVRVKREHHTTKKLYFGWGGMRNHKTQVGVITTIFERPSASLKKTVAIIDFPEMNGWHCNLDEIELDNPDRAETYVPIPLWDGEITLAITTDSMPTTRQTIMTIEARRDGLELVLDLKIDSELEKFIKHTVGGEQTTSERWKDNDGRPLRFYTQTDQYKKVISNFYQKSYGEKIFDDFGSDLLQGMVPNVAPLRIVGLTDGVSFRVTNLVSFDELRQYVERLAAVVRMIYREFLRKESVKIMLTLDV